jgi:flagellar hook-length control protein FliK
VVPSSVPLKTDILAAGFGSVTNSSEVASASSKQISPPSAPFSSSARGELAATNVSSLETNGLREAATSSVGIETKHITSPEGAVNTVQLAKSSGFKLELNEAQHTAIGETLEADLSEFKGVSQTRTELSASINALSGEKLGDISTQASSRFSINVQFGRAEWINDVASQVSKLAAQNLNFAEIRLDPPELGAMQVRVQVNSDQATVSFTAQSSQVRDALEQNGNRLRELFDAEGMNLVDVDVRDQGQHNPEDGLESEPDEPQTDVVSTEGLGSEASVVQAEIPVGVDDYV